MDDELLAARARGGDLDSFGQLYDRYFHRVYDFAWRVLRDADAAAAVSHDVFTHTASGLASIPRGVTFKSWLFAIAHRAVAARAGSVTASPPAMHEEAFGSFDVPDPCRIDQPGLIGQDHELAALVWEAASSLSARDYAMLDLHLRQGLDSAELAPILGATKGNAATMVSRLRAAAGDVMKSYIVARRGSRDCPALQQVLAAFDFPPYTDAIRAAIDAHIKECGACQQTRKRIAPPLDILGAFAGVAAPMSLKGDTWREISGEWSSAAAAPGTEPGSLRMMPSPYQAVMPAAGAGGIGLIGGGGFTGDRWGGGGDGEWDRKRILLFAGAAGGLLAVAFIAAALVYGALGGGDSGGGSGLGAGATRTASASRTATTSGTPPAPVIATATVDLTPSATPRPSETPTREPETQTPVVVTATPAKRTPTPAATKPAQGTATPKSATPAATATKCPPAGCPTPTH
jgi:DNA-directed RNA polymerase specialized sigma24 family protein